MPAKQNAISPVLFMSVEGEPMSFYLCPGPLKRKLQPLITTGGGTLCSVQQPEAILLIDPEERNSIPDSTAHRYVSTQYIHDCVEKNEQLELDSYRLKPKMVQRQSARLNSNRERSPSIYGGRVPYTPEEDAAILQYVTKHKSEVGGNRLWQQMEKQCLTAHSWQSMKYRYKVRLAKKQTRDEVVKTTENKEKEAEEKTEDSDVQKIKEDTVSPQKHPAGTDLTQDGKQLVLAGNESKDEGAEEEKLQAETSDSPPVKEPSVDSQAEDQVTAAETAQPAGDKPESQSEAENSAPAQPETLNTPNRKPEDTQEASPSLELPQRRIARGQAELRGPPSPQPPSKKLRSSPQTSKGEDLEVKSTQQKEGSPEEPPPKKARGKSVRAEAESQSDSEEVQIPETPLTDKSHSEPQRAQKQTGKRPLGILELATKEFESESSEDETPDLQVPVEAAASTGSVFPSSDRAADSGSDEPEPEPEPEPQPGSSLQEIRPQLQASSLNPAATEPSVSPASKAHLFIFESESQEDEGLSAAAAAPSSPPPAGGAAALSLTQVQLEEDMQLIRELMTQSEQDLTTVTKALLKTSGDFSVALKLLLNPSLVSGPFWSRSDDNSLLSADPKTRQELQRKYGEEEVAKRIVFLDVEH